MELFKDQEAASQAWEKIVASIKLGVIITDTAGTVVYANHSAESLIGNKELVGKDFGSMFTNLSPSSMKELQAFVENACMLMPDGTAGETQIAVETPDRRLIQIRSSCVQLGEETELFPSFIIEASIPSVPVTPRKSKLGKEDQSQSIFWESLEKLWESSRMSIEILRSIPSAIFICKIKKGGKLSIIDSNPAAEKLAGKLLAQLQGTMLDDIWAHAGDKSFMKQIIDGNRTSKPFIFEDIHEKDGVFQMAYKMQIFFMPNDRAGVIFDDISSQKIAERLLEEENLRLKELDVMKNNFIAITSHELKTPLVSTCGATEFLLANYDKLEHGPEELKFIEMINRGATRLKQLVLSLLDMSRLQTGKIELNMVEEDLIGVIKRVVEDQAYMLETRNQSLILETPDTLVFMFDSPRVEQILTNLLSNAIKNTQPEGHITIRVTNDDAEVRISVIDDGVGITEKEMDKLFTQFGKMNRDGVDMDLNIQGTGLGLFITREIVNLHGGKIWAESEGRFKGATFTVVLPLNPGTEIKEGRAVILPVDKDMLGKEDYVTRGTGHGKHGRYGGQPE
ncbi:MAG TPA: ATP-binding protein [Candidatus Lokiarchaeia archaeon]|nr:ATP-binding protein [Candidatus Lokiarchaeia archaeon]